MRFTIKELLVELGVPTSLVGFELLEFVFNLCLQKGNCYNLSRDIYSPAANYFCIKTEQVERNIRHAIEQASNRGKLSRLNSLFGVQIFDEKNKPTNKEFISAVLQYIKMQNERTSSVAVYQ